MNEMSNAPIPQSPVNSVLQTWRRAITQPNEQTFAEIASSPNARASTAYLWVFVASLIQALLVALVQNQLFGMYADQLGLGEPFGVRTGISILITALCGAPVAAAISTLVFAIGVLIVQWLAKMFGGIGTNDQLAYAMGAIVAPYTILAGLFTLLSAIPYVGFCFGGLLLLGFLYVLVLEVMAVKGVNRISWGAAIGAVLIPGLVIGFLCLCLIGASIAALMPVFRETIPNFAP